VLEAQAAAVGLPIQFGSATWAGYEAAFRTEIETAAAAGVTTGIFGDIDLQEHREWIEAVCCKAGVSACLPLWQRPRTTVVEELLDAGFRALIVAVRDGVLPRELLGQPIDRAVLREVGRAGADLAGENGEYHTLVVDGPIFESPLEVSVGEHSLRDGVWFADVRPVSVARAAAR
jgi:diphthine-ammonia ligase